MSETTLHDEIIKEQRHVDRVYVRLASLRAEATRAEAQGYKQASVGNFGSLVERDALVYHAARRRHTFDAEHEGLVFGRLDLKPEAVAQDEFTRTRYIGRLGMRAEDGDPLLIDWRAPAAAAFYRATAAQPLGVIRRRMITSFGEKVIALDDDLLDPDAASDEIIVVGDGALMAALSRAKGTGMRDIVATIQHEQDLAIRAPAGGVTMVEGGPGTGKTAVALHRAAYLLYTDRQRFAGGGVLIVGPSPVFVQYIETVLPALGEESATLKSLGQLVVGFDATREETAAVRAVKGSLRMRRILRRAVEDAPPGAPDGLHIRYRGEWLVLTRKQVEEVRRRVSRGARRNEVRGRAFGEILDLLWEKHGEATRVEQSRFDEELSDHEGFRAFLRAWWPIVTPLEVLGWLADPHKVRRYADGVLSHDEQRRLSQSIKDDPSIDDIPLLDELAELIGKQPKPRQRARRQAQSLGIVSQQQRAERPADYRDYAHVVVDESQDVTPMQWRMIGRRGHAASWTIVGDPAQSAWIGSTNEPPRARDEAIGGGRARHFHRLTTNYRNSKEIFEVAAQVIRRVSPDIPLPNAVRSTGIAPQDIRTAPRELPNAVREAVVRLREQVEGTIGVIAPDAAVRDAAMRWIEMDERTSVVTALAAKGMEYDAVVLVEPALVDSPRTLYVALSRATQRLTTVSTTDWH
ncbi:MAG TPA: AAA family ATPase [Candidatus Limnocylindrales bacterium]|nr:AAA family ATPase [Candidatus Limnocylindrales bacterium]